MSYQERLAAMRAAQEARPRTYLTNEEYGRQKAALTRARNSGDPAKVLKTVEAAVELWDERVWPDDWSLWRIALEDVGRQACRRAWDELDEAVAERLGTQGRECLAAAQVLFR